MRNMVRCFIMTGWCGGVHRRRRNRLHLHYPQGAQHLMHIRRSGNSTCRSQRKCNCCAVTGKLPADLLNGTPIKCALGNHTGKFLALIVTGQMRHAWASMAEVAGHAKPSGSSTLSVSAQE